MQKSKYTQVRAVTLVEMMVVMFIMLTMASLALAFSVNMLNNQRLRQSSEDIRAEWSRLRVAAMQEGKVYCFRCRYGSGTYRIDRIFDVHFSAAIPTIDSADMFQNDPYADTVIDPDELTQEDFSIQNPESVSTNGREPFRNLPEKCFFTDGYVTPDTRDKYYLYAQGASSYSFSGTDWSEPILFYPDGTTSTATLLLKNVHGRCIEMHLRGLTGISAISGISTENSYAGYLDATGTETITP